MSGLAILHSAAGPIQRYEEELYGVLGDKEERGDQGAVPGGGGQREPIDVASNDPDYKEIEQREAEKLRTEERQREEAVRAEEKKERAEERQRNEEVRREEKAEQEKIRKEEREASSSALAAASPAPSRPAPQEPPTVISSYPQPVTDSVRQTSARTSGGTGRT